MFDLAIIHRPGLAHGKQDIGRILEAMLYYDRVHLVIGGQLFTGLWDQLAAKDLVALLGHPSLTSTITPEMVGVRSDTKNGLTTHAPVAFKLAGRAGKLLHESDDAGSLLTLVQGNPNHSVATRAQINGVLKHAKTSRYSKILGGAEADARFFALALDPQTLKLFLRGWADGHGHQINEANFAQLKIIGEQIGRELLIGASHPISDIIIGWDDASEWGQILNGVHDYAIDLYLSSSLSGDIITAPGVAEVAAARVDLTIQRATRSGYQISAFEEMVFEEAHGFREAYNDGLIDLREALTIVDEAQKFRTWAGGLAPDANLLSEYHRAITTDTALKRFPGNVVRFGLFSSLGFLGDWVMPGASVGLSAIDSFILDRLTGGWRPNIFVRKVNRRLGKAKERARANFAE